MTLPDLESLRCFVAAAERLHFGRAAEAVALSPAAFSGRIRALEDQLGGSLFERTTRSVRLTPAGQRLLPQAQRCLEAARGCVALVAPSQTTFTYELTLGTRYELGMSWLVPALDPLQRCEPARTIHLYFGNTPELLPRVLEGDLDAMVTSARITQEELAYVPLHEERYVFVTSPALRTAQPLTRAGDAKEHTLVDAGRDLPLFRYFLDGRPGDEIWSFASYQYMGTIAAIRAQVLAGAGVAVLPQYYVAADLRAGRLVRLMPRSRIPSDWFRLVFRSAHLRKQELHALGAELSKLRLR